MVGLAALDPPDMVRPVKSRVVIFFDTWFLSEVEFWARQNTTVDQPDIRGLVTYMA